MTIKSKPISVLARPTWLDKAGMSKGVDHDRQHLGIILAAGQTIKARQTNSAFKGELTLRLLNDDRNTETSKKIGSDWVSASINAVSVPFIDTPYYDKPEGKVEPVIEYDYPNESKLLPVYRKGYNEIEFFVHWDMLSTEFALIDSHYTQILIPTRDKDALKHPQGVDNIDGLIDFFDSVFSFDNSLAGLSFEPEYASDQNIANRYFMKLISTYTAASESSIKNWWLEPRATNWGNLHEIAHGYQASFKNDGYFWNGEVSNNIYAACYQSAMLGDRKYKEGWLYNYGKQEEVEKGIVDTINAKTPLDKWDLRAKLYFLMTMIDKAGWDSFADFNQQYRLVANKPGFQVSNHLVLDMLSESIVRTANLDVTPFVQICNGYLSPEQLGYNQFSQARVAYPLNQLVYGSTLDNIQRILKLQSPFTLIEVQQLLAIGMKGDAKLRLEVDYFEQIYGKTITVLDGSRVVREVRIQDSSVDLLGLPIGVYTLRLPTGRSRKYETDHRYLAVKPWSAELKIDFKPKTSSMLASQKINLLGLGDDIFGTILVDQANAVLEVAVTREDPHSYFGDETYAQVIIKDKAGSEKFRVTMPGTGAKLSNDKVPFEPGYTLEVYHQEPSRVQLSPAFDGVVNHKEKTNTFDITAGGLRNQSLNNDPLQGLLARIEAAATELRSRPTMLRADSPAKVDIWLAINQFSGTQRDDLLRQYADCLPADNDPPAEELGNSFTLDFRGISDHRFLKVDVDLLNKKLKVILEAGVAHHYFNDTYASLRYLDADANEHFNLDIKGIKDQKAEEWSFPCSGYGGEVLQIRHEEPENRFVVINNMRNRRLSGRAKLQNYRITPTGLELIA